MKVVAQTGGKTFLVSCTAEELDALAGGKIGTEYGCYERRDCLNVEFKVCSAWNRLNRDDRRLSEVKAVRKQLLNIIEGLDIIEPFIEEPEIETPEPVSAAE